MKKQFFSALMCGAVVLSAGTFVSCDNGIDELSSRVSVLEGYISEIKAQLQNALTTGASITSATQDEKTGAWTLVLSNGQTIEIKASAGGAGGGSDVTVAQGEGSFTITVDGTAYTIPTGASVNSLVYVPEYSDGLVVLGNDGAKVRLLATPSVDVSKASFDIAVAEELKTRASSLLKVDGVASENGYVVVTLKGLGVEAGKSYAVVISMTSGGTTITSDSIIVKVADDFSFNTEEIGGVTIKAEYNPTEVDANGFCAMTVVGSKLLEDGLNFSTFFDVLPEGAKFQAAPNANQPGGKAQEKSGVIAASLKEDGSFAWSERPGTAFNENAERPGFLVYVTANDVIKAKIYVVINDELAGLETAFEGGRTGNFEAEWGGREKALQLGVNEIDICKVWTNYLEEITIRHGSSDDWFALWPEYTVMTAAEDVILFNDGGKLTLGDLGKTYAKGCRGIYWFYRGFAIYVPESFAPEGENFVDETGSYGRGEGYGVDMWMGQYNEYIYNAENWYNGCAQWGITLDEATGILRTPESYTGYGLRIAFDGGYEYAYGVYPFHGAGSDQCGMLFFNRRVAPDGAAMPAK
ncbi:MAG: hypothetical protein IJX11_01310 [Bacteroidales bacterium]|nr:hypothetical protein [Bacteroidales bacterium]